MQARKTVCGFHDLGPFPKDGADALGRKGVPDPGHGLAFCFVMLGFVCTWVSAEPGKVWGADGSAPPVAASLPGLTPWAEPQDASSSGEHLLSLTGTLEIKQWVSIFPR